MVNWDKIVNDIATGYGNEHWESLVKVIMTADDREYARLCAMYPDLMDAIERFNRSHTFMKEVRFIRKQRSK